MNIQQTNMNIPFLRIFPNKHRISKCIWTACGNNKGSPSCFSFQNFLSELFI